ncbi:MAG: hypothetical protein COS84_09520, partial [Armatimonadetes bacterium CG07_land_8_20_14_0_80_40_9]
LSNQTAAATLSRLDLEGYSPTVQAEPPCDTNLANGDSTPTLKVKVSGGTEGSGTVRIDGKGVLAVLNSTPAGTTMDPEEPPISGDPPCHPLPSPSQLMVIVAGGTPGSGTVKISGKVGGLDDTETLTFAANGSIQTTKLFESIDKDGITTTGLVDETPKAKITILTATAMGMTEEVKFLENGTMNTLKKFAKVDSITTTGFTDESPKPNIKVSCASWAGTIKY